MVPRFYAPALQPDSMSVALPPDEAEHLTRVLRLAAGATVRAFDGRGFECVARVQQADRRDVRLEIVTPVEASAEPRVRITLAQAVLKGDKMEGRIRDGVMLGVTAVQPLLTVRTDVPEAALASGHRLDRWRRIVIASVKQCGRAVVPEIEAAMTLQACLARAHEGLRVMLVEPGAVEGVTTAGGLRDHAGLAAAQVLVGPEGGWAPEEVAQARAAGCVLVTLGRRTLRADATPLIALGVLQYLWGDL